MAKRHDDATITFRYSRLLKKQKRKGKKEERKREKWNNKNGRFSKAFLIKFTLFVRFSLGGGGGQPLGNTNELPVSGMSVRGMANERGRAARSIRKEGCCRSLRVDS